MLRTCLRAGISMAEIRAVLDHAAVREAESFLHNNAKKPTYSNISIITGIQRRRVARLLAKQTLDVEVPSAASLHRAQRVLKGWHEDAEFMTPRGSPADLPIKGSSRSFESLVKRYAGGVGASALLRHLIDSRTMEIVAKSRTGRPTRVRALHSSVSPEIPNSRLFEEFGELFGDALEGFDNNVASHNPATRLRPTTVTAKVRTSDIHAVRRRILESTEFARSSLEEALDPFNVSASRDAAVLGAEVDVSQVRVTVLSSIVEQPSRRTEIRRAWRRERNTGPEESDPKPNQPRAKAQAKKKQAP
jgi:hypothetical protein